MADRMSTQEPVQLRPVFRMPVFLEERDDDFEEFVWRPSREDHRRAAVAFHASLDDLRAGGGVTWRMLLVILDESVATAKTGATLTPGEARAACLGIHPQSRESA